MSRAPSSLITPPYLWNFLLEFIFQYSVEFSPMKMGQLAGIEKFYLNQNAIHYSTAHIGLRS